MGPDIQLSVKKRRPSPITFQLGGERAVTTPVLGDDDQPVLDKKGQQVTEVIITADDHDYVFTPPKRAVASLPIIEQIEAGEMMTQIELMRSEFNWLGAGLSDEDNARIRARLIDPDDDLDIDDLSELMKLLQGKLAGRPTT